MGLLQVAAHTVAIVALATAGLRTVGRRALRQLTVADVVAVLLLGSAVETAMVAGNTTLAAGLVSAAVLLGLNRLAAVVLARLPRARHLVGGVPLLIVHDGRILDAHLRRAGLTRADLEEALRQRGEVDPATLRAAVLEPDGALHVIPS